eukprot:TRINITY_DN21732_c0_g1_i2.p2 TRINITY_DN21732_c0_g1~~TRINITY_DN21732_c0_g1_i2.p2  ORF type:complete len:298 (+),score=118.40 TRINITY_DN21732_c0_g1_i2:69-962(+)
MSDEVHAMLAKMKKRAMRARAASSDIEDERRRRAAFKRKRAPSTDSEEDERRRRAAGMVRRRASSESVQKEPTESESESSSSGLNPDGLVPSGFRGRAAPGGQTSWLDRMLNSQADKRRDNIKKTRKKQADEAAERRRQAAVQKQKDETDARVNSFLEVAKQQEDGESNMNSFFAQMFPDEARKLKAEAAGKQKKKRFKCRYPVGCAVKYVGGGKYGVGQDVRWNHVVDRLRPGQEGSVIRVDEKSEDPYICQFPEVKEVPLRELDLQRVLVTAAAGDAAEHEKEREDGADDADAEC